MENLDQIHKAVEFYDLQKALRLKERRLEEERRKLAKEREEIDKTNKSVGYLKTKYEKSVLEKKVLESGEDTSHQALKVHLFASKAESESLKKKLDLLNTVLGIGPYVYVLVDKSMDKIQWVSANVEKVLGYKPRDFRALALNDLIGNSSREPIVLDGLLMNRVIRTAAGRDLNIDLSFQPFEEYILVTFHTVEQRVRMLS